MISSTYYETPLQRPWLKIAVLVICILLCSSLGRTLWFSYQTQRAISHQEIQVRELEKKVELLEGDVKVATSSFMLDKRVRDELQYQKPGENVFRVQ